MSVDWPDLILPPINLWNYPDWRNMNYEEYRELLEEDRYTPHYACRVLGSNFEKENKLKTWKTLPLVIADLASREAKGVDKYGRVLGAGHPDDMLQHLYEELLDACMYIRTLLEQRKEK